MGNRATIEVRDQASTAPCYVYIHWMGDQEQVIDMVKRAAPVMRRTDASYATARLIGTYHVEIDGGLSLGVTEYKEEYDNGHYVVDMCQGTIMNCDQTVAEGIEFGQF